MAKASDNPFPSLLLVEGAAPAAPAAGRQRLFVDSADHKVKRVDSAGSVSTVEGGGGSSSIPVTRITITAGDITLASTNWATVNTVTLPAAVGDIIEIGLSTRTHNGQASAETYFNAASIVAGAIVNVAECGGYSAPAAGEGVQAWMGNSTAPQDFTGAIIWGAVQAGDLSGGNLTLALIYRTAGGGNRTIRASASDPFQFWAKNLRH